MVKTTEKKYRSLEKIIKLLFRGLIPIVFLMAGMGILALRIPGWSLFLGIPLTIFGTVFLIYTYDEVVRRTLPLPKEPEVVKCSVCGRTMPFLPGASSKNTVCPACKKEGKNQ